MFLLTDFLNTVFKKYSYLSYEKKRIMKNSSTFRDLIKPWGAEHLVVYVNEKEVFNSYDKKEMPRYLFKTINMYFADIEQNHDILLTEAKKIIEKENRSEAIAALNALSAIPTSLKKIMDTDILRELLGINIKDKVMNLSFMPEMKSLQLQT